MPTREVIVNPKRNGQTKFSQAVKKEVTPGVWTEGGVQDDPPILGPSEAQIDAEEKPELADYLH